MKRRLALQLLGSVFATAAALPVTPALAQDQKPNIVFILVDNVGWETFGVYGGTVPTPRIDRTENQGSASRSETGIRRGLGPRSPSQWPAAFRDGKAPEETRNARS